MLNVYCINIPSELQSRLVQYNDQFFDMEFYSKKAAVDQNIINLIKHIDGSKYAGNGFIRTVAGNGPDLTYLSTGCKTAINVYTFSNYIFSLEEIGDNAKEEIFKLKTGNIVIDTLPILDCGNIINEYRLIGLYKTPQIYESYSDLFNGIERWGL